MGVWRGSGCLAPGLWLRGSRGSRAADGDVKTGSARRIMTRRLSSSTRSHTEDSIFLRPEEDPVWLDEPTKTDKKGDGARKKDELKDCKDGLAGGQSPQAEEVFMHKVYALVIEIHCWAALGTGCFLVEGNGPLSSIYKALHVIDFYLGFILPCHPIFGMDSMVLMGEVVNTAEHNWIVNGTAGIGVAICVIMVIHMVRKWRYGTGFGSFGTVSRDIGDRRQSVSRSLPSPCQSGRTLRRT
ncbi:hypothetical protein F7725_022642 [Dissostichus mawsoni]|uniref:Uncharacterized protein n=1 Tax=Dissostichus mawsoni TaxID=36200 RepID=A0A7J5Z1E8_DISMA|nr:hypothetical protein F7725_022642 [Dissostichus mawsoni]